MSADTERLFVQLEARIADFEKRMGKAEKRGTRTYRGLQRGSATATRRMERDMTRSSRRINAALAGTATAAKTVRRSLMMIGLPLAGAAGLGGLTRGVRGAVSDLSDLGKSARDVSLDVEDLQGLMRGFERETRITGDQAVQAFERFNRRVGEAANGTGEMNRIVERYRIRLRNANGELRDQGDLVREVANAIRDAATDQERAAIAQAAFGDVGRQMADAMSEGSSAIDRMIREAMDAGAVIDRDLISRAEELDDRFDDLTRRASVFFKTIAVESASFVENFTDMKNTLDTLFGSEDAARAALGDNIFDQLAGNTDKLRAAEPIIGNLNQSMQALTQATEAAVADFDTFAHNLERVGEGEAAAQLRSIGDEMLSLVDQYREGGISAEDFSEKLTDTTTNALMLTTELNGVDAVGFDSVISRIGSLQGALKSAIGFARSLRDAISGEAGTTPELSPIIQGTGEISNAAAERERAAASLREFLNEEERLASRTRERIDLERELAQVQSRAREDGIELTEAQAEAQAKANLALRESVTDTGGGGGGGSPGDFMRTVDSIRERANAMNEEAQAITIAAQSNMEYGQALQYAQARARLLTAAQAEGLAITPELEMAVHGLAEAYAQAGGMAVHGLAEAYAQAGGSAQDATEKLREAGREGERFGQELGSVFASAAKSADSLSDALSNVLDRLGDILINEAFNTIFGGGIFGGGGGSSVTGANILGATSKFLSFDGGGYTGSGPRTGGLDGRGAFPALLHPRETVIDHTKGGANRNQNVNINVNVEGANGDKHVIDLVHQGVTQGLKQYDRTLPGRVKQISNDPRRR